MLKQCESLSLNFWDRHQARFSPDFSWKTSWRWRSHVLDFSNNSRIRSRNILGTIVFGFILYVLYIMGSVLKMVHMILEDYSKTRVCFNNFLLQNKQDYYHYMQYNGQIRGCTWNITFDFFLCFEIICARFTK